MNELLPEELEALFHPERLAELKREIQIGLNDLEQGKMVPGEQVFEELRRRSEERYKQ